VSHLVGLDILFLPLLYLPGFIAFKFYTYILRSSRKYNAYETTMYALFFSVVSLLIIIIFKLGLNLSVDSDELLNIRLTFFEFILFYLVTLFAGVASGLIRKFVEELIRIKTQDCWSDFFGKIEKEPVVLQVITTDQKEFIGLFDYAGTRYDRRELSLLDAQQVFRNKLNRVSRTMYPVDRIIFTEKDISRISVPPKLE